MTVTQTLNALGGWEIRLVEATPDYLVNQLGFFGHVALVDGPVDVSAVGDGLLTGARYVGVLRAKDKATGRTLSGSGMLFWLGDEDGKGDILEAELDLSGMTLTAAVTAVIDPSTAVNVGTVHAQPGTLPANSKYQYLTRREVLNQIADAFGVEFRVNGNATVDVGTAAQLYNTEVPTSHSFEVATAGFGLQPFGTSSFGGAEIVTEDGGPRTIIKRKGAGTDMGLAALGGDYEVDESVYDYSSRVVLLGQTIGSGDTPDEVFATGSADAPAVPYVNLLGSPVKMVRTISESGTTSGSVTARAALQLNRFNRVARSLKVSAEEYESEGRFVVGDNVYVYDPDTGIVNPAIEVTFRGEVLHPDIVRASGITWPVVQGMTVAFRTQAGVWLDLTPFVTWETGGNELTVGDLPKSLTKPSDNPIQVRVDAARADASIPNPPTALTLTTSSALNAQGQTVAIIHVSWTAPTLNTDGSVLTDLSHYVVQYRWTARAPQWQEAQVTAGIERDVTVTPGLPYEVRVAAVDLGGKLSAWTSIGTITSAADAIAPNAPADPVVTSYLGQLRIEYAGTDNLGNPMAADTNRIDVHVSATSGFTPSLATRVDSLTPQAKGVSYATAPYGSARYVKLVAVDHSGNPSSASGQVSGSTVQVADGDVASMSVGKLTAGIMTADVTISGRFATALTGARREMNAVGFQAWDASNNLTVSLDGSNNLLTGKLQTAITGRRIVTGSSGTVGQLEFYAPDGTKSLLRAFTSGLSTGGVEAIGMSVPITGAHDSWNGFTSTSDENMFLTARFITAIVGGTATGARGFVIEYSPEKVNLDVASGRRDLLNVLPDSTESMITTAGQFLIQEKPTSGADRKRLWIRGNGENYYYALNVGNGHVFYTSTAAGVNSDRLWLNGAGQNYYYAEAATDAHVFYERSGASIKARFWLDGAGDTILYHNTAQGFYINEVNPSNVVSNRMRILQNEVYFINPGTNAQGVYWTYDATKASPNFHLLGPNNYGVKIFYNDSAGNGVNQRTEFMDAGGTVFMPLWAASFVVSSSEVGKEGIRPMEGGALDTLRGQEVVHFRRKRGKRGRPDRRKPRVPSEGDMTAEEVDEPTVEESTEPAREELGIIAEKAPPAWVIDGGERGPMVDHVAWTATNTAAIQELAAIVDSLKKGKP